MNMISKDPDSGRIQFKDKPCMQCFHCTAVCPHHAIRVTGMERRQIYKTVPDNLLLAAIETRRSVRHFKEVAPDRDVIQRALDAAAYAPSGKNQHRNRWIVVMGRENTDKLYEMVLDWAKDVESYDHLLRLQEKGHNPVTCSAPCIILGYNRTDALNPQSDTVIAMTLAEQMLVEQGLSTCWGGYLRTASQNSPALQEWLGLPEGCRVYETLIVGYADHEEYVSVPYRPAAEPHWIG